MKRISSFIVAVLLLLCACNYVEPPKSAVAEDTSAETYISIIDDIETTIEETETETKIEINSDYTFEAADEENTYYLTNISGEFTKITDFSVIADYADATSIPKRRIEVYFDDREYPLFIDYIDGKADLENVNIYFNPLTEDIPEIAIPLSPNESCKIVLITPYEIKLPEASEVSYKLTPPKYTHNDYGLYFDNYWNDETGETKTIIYRTDGKSITTKERMYDYINYSLDRTKAAFNQSADYQLFYISAVHMEPIFIDYHVRYFKMAISGNGIAYTDSEMSNDYLYLWDGKVKTKITEKCYDPDEFFISPDGQGVLYKEYKDNALGFYYYENGKSTFVGKNFEPIALADDGYIYYEEDNALYIQKGNDTENRITLLENKDKNLRYTYGFNKDLTEMIFESDNKFYIVKDFDTIIPISDNFDFIDGYNIFPVNTARDDSENIYGIDSFAGTIYLSFDRNIYCFDDNFNLQVLVKNAVPPEAEHLYMTDYQLSRDGRDLVVKSYGDLYHVDLQSPNTIEKYDINDNVSHFALTDDGKGLYCFTEKQELWFAQRNSEPRLLASDLPEYNLNPYDNNHCQIINNDEMYFTTGGTFCYTDGKTVEKLTPDDKFYLEVIVYSGIIYLYGGHNTDYSYIVFNDGTFIEMQD
ncbi:MAG: hypothetical protein LBM41_00205 [Ruminococcus sp.]|jgi:hypothetical protein|nr:hypothetical protein [Ruminococcus sp.]